MTIMELQTIVDQWIKEYGVRYFNEMTNTVVLMEEVGELSRLMARVYGEQSFKNDTDKSSAHEKIEDELADILFVVTCLANQMDIDLARAMKKNMDKKTQRDHSRHRDNQKL